MSFLTYTPGVGMQFGSTLGLSALSGEPNGTGEPICTGAPTAAVESIGLDHNGPCPSDFKIGLL